MGRTDLVLQQPLERTHAGPGNHPPRAQRGHHLLDLVLIESGATQSDELPRRYRASCDRWLHPALPRDPELDAYSLAARRPDQ